MKKLIALCLSMILALSLAVPAAANGPQLISAAPDPNSVAVMVNGEYVTFPDGVPEVTNGRTMVPMRAVLEALGAQVDYDADTQTVSATLGSTILTHTVGTGLITLSPRKLTADSLTAGGAKLTMDTVSYVKNGSTLVPLRFFSQALGCEVYWDEGQRTAVVIDKQAVVAELDKNFTIINSAQASQTGALDTSGNLRMDMDLSGEAMLLDPAVGGQAVPFSMRMTALYGPEAMNLSGTMDLSAVGTLMAALGEEVPPEAETLLKDLSFQIICGESLWLQMPALTLVLGLRAGSGVWLKLDDAGMSAMGAMGMSAEGNTMGNVLYTMAEFADAEVPVMIYDDLIQAGEMLTALMGDDTFTKNGEDYAWKLDQGSVDLLAGILGSSSVNFPGSVELTVKAGGGCDFAMELSMDEAALSISGSSTGTASSIQGQVRVEGVCSVTFQGETVVAAADTAPDSAPPADAVVVDLGELSAAPLAA